MVQHFKMGLDGTPVRVPCSLRRLSRWTGKDSGQAGMTGKNLPSPCPAARFLAMVRKVRYRVTPIGKGETAHNVKMDSRLRHSGMTEQETTRRDCHAALAMTAGYPVLAGWNQKIPKKREFRAVSVNVTNYFVAKIKFLKKQAVTWSQKMKQM